MDPVDVPAKFELRSFRPTHSRDNSDIGVLALLGGGCERQILRKRRLYGVGDGTVRKSVNKIL